MNSESEEKCFICEQLLKPKTRVMNREDEEEEIQNAQVSVSKIIERYSLFGKSVCMQNTKHRKQNGTKRSAIPDQLKTQWDFVVTYSKNAHDLAVSHGRPPLPILEPMSAEMLEEHFMEHLDDAEIQNARNRFFMSDAIRRKRAKIASLWEEDPTGDAEELLDKEKDSMNDFIKYQKTYASMTGRESASNQKPQTNDR